MPWTLPFFVYFFSLSAFSQTCNNGDQATALTIDTKRLLNITECRLTNRKTVNPVALYDGPNCFNAVFAGKGFLDALTHTSQDEAFYYLKRFCHLVKGPAVSGDILSVEIENSLEHLALKLSGENIFEKTSTWGRYDMLSSAQDGRAETQKIKELHQRIVASQYSIKHQVQSPYFNEIAKKNSARSYKVYRCDNEKSVRSKLSTAAATPSVRVIESLNVSLESVIFGSSKHSDWREQVTPSLRKIGDLFASSEGNSENDLFAYLKLVSLADQIFHLNRWTEKSNPPEFDSALAKLQQASKLARQRLEATGDSLALELLKLRNH